MDEARARQVRGLAEATQTPRERALSVWFGLLAAAAIQLTHAAATTLTVGQDGRAQYEVIQDALDASAPGDSVLIFPGTYTELRPAVESGGHVIDAAMGITVPGLSIIGVDRDSVIVGPVIPNYEAAGLATSLIAPDSLYIEGITFRGFDDGMRLSGVVSMRQMRLLECTEGVVVFRDRAKIVDSRFIDTYTEGVVVRRADVVQVDYCLFIGSRVGVSFTDCRVGDVQNSLLGSTRVGIEFLAGSSGSVRTTIANIGRGTALAVDNSSVVVESCMLQGHEAALLLVSGASFLGRNSEFVSDKVAAFLHGPVEATVNASSILSSPGRLVEIWQFSAPEVVSLNFENNYWGTTDSTAIADGIHDHLDDPEEKAIIDFYPFATEGVPLPAKSVGAVKGGY